MTVLNGPTLTAVPNIAPLDLEGLACRCGVLQHEDGLLAGLESLDPHVSLITESPVSPFSTSLFLLPTPHRAIQPAVTTCAGELVEYRLRVEITSPGVVHIWSHLFFGAGRGSGLYFFHLRARPLTVPPRALPPPAPASMSRPSPSPPKPWERAGATPAAALPLASPLPAAPMAAAGAAGVPALPERPTTMGSAGTGELPRLVPR